MSDGRASISKGRSYEEMGDYWDTHDAGEIWTQTRPAEFEVDIGQETSYFPLAQELSETVFKIAKDLGLSAHVLVSQWVKEKVTELGQREHA